MNNNPYYDIIIIGSGISGLYTAFNIKKKLKNISLLILEKNEKKLKGGRSNNDTFYGCEISTGAGIGRVDKNPLLIKLMKDCKIKRSNFNVNMNYSSTFEHVDIIKIVNYLKKMYSKRKDLHNLTFKDFFIKIINAEIYNKFIISSGYSDYENADIYDTLYNYGFDDTISGWNAFFVPWKLLVETLYNKIGSEHFKFNRNVISINKTENNLYQIKTETGFIYNCNKVIIASTIDVIKKLVPGASNKDSIYQQIHGQTFLRLYGKFNKKSSEIMKKYISNYTIVPGPLQKIIPVNIDLGVYMIAYSDNHNAFSLKNNLENNTENYKLYCALIEKALGIPKDSLQLLAIKHYYWEIGTHYYEPLTNQFKNRDDFLKKIQHPHNNMLVVGEAVSRYQGWVEGALESVEKVLNYII